MARPEDIKPFAHTIRKQALRLVSLAEDIIQLSQLEENDGEILFEEVNLTELASDCVQSLQINAQSRTVDLHLAAPKAPIYIKGNKSLLEELLVLPQAVAVTNRAAIKAATIIFFIIKSPLKVN